MAGLSRLLAIVAAIAAGVPAAADPSPSRKGDPNQIVCERIKPSGSLVTRKVCGTRAQWAELRKRERALANQARRNAPSCQQVVMYPNSARCR